MIDNFPLPRSCDVQLDSTKESWEVVSRALIFLFGFKEAETSTVFTLNRLRVCRNGVEVHCFLENGALRFMVVAPVMKVRNTKKYLGFTKDPQGGGYSKLVDCSFRSSEDLVQTIFGISQVVGVADRIVRDNVSRFSEYPQSVGAEREILGIRPKFHLCKTFRDVREEVRRDVFLTSDLDAFLDQAVIGMLYGGGMSAFGVLVAGAPVGIPNLLMGMDSYRAAIETMLFSPESVGVIKKIIVDVSGVVVSALTCGVGIGAYMVVFKNLSKLVMSRKGLESKQT